MRHHTADIKGHLNSIGKLLQEDEYYVKESCLQLLSWLGPLALRHCVDQILAIIDDEDEEEEVRFDYLVARDSLVSPQTCVTEIALFGMGQLLAYEKEHAAVGKRIERLFTPPF